MNGDPPLPLSQLDVLVVDCQATAAAPRGHLVELGWAQVGRATTAGGTRLISLPPQAQMPPAIARITGISARMLADGVAASLAWQELVEQARQLPQQPAPTVIHFARFERPFLETLARGVLPLDVVCAHEIARRLLPDLPRRGLRALAGYFGRAVGTLRRSTDHVTATAFVWRELAGLLDEQGIATWPALQAWLTNAPAASRRRRVWPMPRATRLAVPDAPGVYRMLRTSGDVLYIGKAASLHHRVNSYFRKQRGIPERMLEMLSQARGLAYEVMPTALEAALLEADEIKRCRPPYNRALSADDRDVWFTARDLTARSRQPSARCRLGPFPSAETLDQFSALAKGSRMSLARGRWGPDAVTFKEGLARFRSTHGELSRQDLEVRARLLWLGTRLWREGRRDRDDDEEASREVGRISPDWTPEIVQSSLERLVVRAALSRRRAIWFTMVVDAAVRWQEPGASDTRLVLIDRGEVTCRASRADEMIPASSGCGRSIADRQQALSSLACFDRMRVLTTELKRLVAANAQVTVRLGAAAPLSGTRLAATLWWI